jgi:hypothetical protein
MNRGVRMDRSTWWVAALLLVGACQKHDQTSAQIGATGGVVTGANGVSISVPQGALAGPAPITIEVSSETIPGSVGTVYKLGPEGQTFTAPVTVTLDFDPTRLPQGKTAADLVVLTAPSGSIEFATLAAQSLDATHVQASTTHFSIFAAAIAAAPVVDAGADGPACTPVGHACMSGASCCAPGTCLNAICATPNNNCGQGQTPCNGTCVNTATDATNCGGCGKVCGNPTPVCISGACSPPAA